MRSSLRSRLSAVLAAACMLASSASIAASTDMRNAPVVLVATGDGVEAFGEAVVLAVPVGDDRHLGFVLNAPGEAALAALLPDEDTGRHADDIVFHGGPQLPSGLFALVRRNGDATVGLKEITADLSLALRAEQVDKLIRDPVADVRFYTGVLLWAPGALDSEVDDGAWRVLAADSRLVMTADPANLWRRLAERPSLRDVRLVRSACVHGREDGPCPMKPSRGAAQPR